MEDFGESLLKKQYYHENCPGCKVDQAKALKKDVTFRNAFNIWIVVLCSSLPIASLFPYLYFMVKDFNIAKTEEDISSYAGYVGSAYMLGRASTSILWGMIADRYGRKPVVIIGIISVIIFNTLFGLCTSFWMAVTMRFVLGGLNGLLGPMKAYSSEIFREEYQALGQSTVAAAWGVGLVFGPALGGYLAQPVQKYPNIFPKDSFWDKFPYFLPCFIVSAMAFVVAISCIWLPETLHNHKVSTNKIEALENGTNEDEKNKTIQKDESLLKNWPLMSSIIVYCVFAIHDVAFAEIFSLWAESPRRLGGLNFGTNDVGNILAVSGVGIIMFQLGLYQSVQKICGPIVLARIAGVLSIPILQSFPFMTMLSGFTLYISIYSASILKNLLIEIISTGLFILQNKAVDQHQRGVANGLCITAMSACKVIGPAGGGAILTWSQKRMDASFLPGPHLVFFVLNVIEGLALLLTFKPFLIERKPPSEQLR
ncbi:putative major facilitator superfamily [Medicago truncatula]|uniref:Putative major facilitator superfamily n=1 Tax=Medicago truncatula TaxID=3880 RepID=G7IVI3_MEDTR|nr:protein ZINC INDUCED FACILITATOR-LIKE 1 [Medicago truncatula]AES68621.1 zinc induced facilitator-like protein [Medicago truncatula]RHN65489.1 putative major facilitator superfamily [Medicago truncatula]